MVCIRSCVYCTSCTSMNYIGQQYASVLDLLCWCWWEMDTQITIRTNVHTWRWIPPIKAATQRSRLLGLLFTRFDQIGRCGFARFRDINYCYDVDDVCVIYMKHIYRLRSLILGGAPSITGGPGSRNTNSMWLFSCKARASCKISCYLCKTYTSYAHYCDKSINLLLQQVQLRIEL